MVCVSGLSAKDQGPSPVTANYLWPQGGRRGPKNSVMAPARNPPNWVGPITSQAAASLGLCDRTSRILPPIHHPPMSEQPRPRPRRRHDAAQHVRQQRRLVDGRGGSPPPTRPTSTPPNQHRPFPPE